jgi:hypothetical protein
MREPDGVEWLLISLVLSVILTVLLNVGLRAFPTAGERVARRLDELTSPRHGGAQAHGKRVRVFAPWKLMILVSLGLTIVLNVVLWIA